MFQSLKGKLLMNTGMLMTRSMMGPCKMVGRIMLRIIIGTVTLILLVMLLMMSMMMRIKKMGP